MTDATRSGESAPAPDDPRRASARDDAARRTAHSGDAVAPAPATSRDDTAERAIGRVAALGLPVATIVGAIAAGAAAGPGSSLLVLASGALLATIALLWASLRTLSGEAPLPRKFEGSPVHRRETTELFERKRRVLRALKDLEGDHAVGKIDDDDYEALSARCRDEAKEIMREIELQAGPARVEAERIAAEYLERRARHEDTAHRETHREDRGAERSRLACRRCGASNEADAEFCKRCGFALENSGG